MPIGKIVIDLEAQHAAFSKGIDECKGKLTELSDTAESVKHLIEGALGFAGVEMGVSKLKEMWSATSEGVVEAYRLSSALGITTASLQSLQTAGLLSAGVKAEEFNGILQKLTKSLGAAETGTGPAADALYKLGLAGGQLKGAKVDQAFTRIAEEIGKIKDPAEQARMATELFGREGQRLLPLFAEGAEGIAKATAEAKRLGIALSDVDAAKVMSAHEAMEKVGLAVQGIENQFAVAVAPVLEAMADKMAPLVPDADSMRAGIMSALRYVAEGVGYVVDAWHVLDLAAEGVSLAIVSGLEIVTKTIQTVAEGIVWVANKLGANTSVPEWITSTQNTVDAWRQQIQSDMATTASSLAHPQSAQWGGFFGDVQNKAASTAAAMADHKHSIGGAMADDFEANAKKIDGILAGLKTSIEQFGMSESQKKVAELKAAGASAGEIDQATKMAAQLDALTAQKKAHEEIAKLQTDVATFGMDAAGKTLETLKAAGASSGDVARVDALQKQLTVLEQQKKVNEELDRMQKEMAQSGMTAAQKQLDDLKRAGATDQQIGQAKQMADQIDAAKEQAKLMEEGKKMMEASLTPAQKFSEQLNKLDEMYSRGAIDQQTYQAEINKATKEMHKVDMDAANKKVATVERRFDFRLPTQKSASNDPAHQQVSELKKMNRTMTTMSKDVGKKPQVATI